MSSVNNYTNSGSYSVETQGQSLDVASRETLEASSMSKIVKGKETPINSEHQETAELHSIASAQEREILHLREQIALASIKESQLLNEKYALERDFSELRMALDEKQQEAITIASNELARRKGDLDVNLNLINELKAVEDDKHIFTTSMLGILDQYGALPHATNALALTNSIKQLHDQMQSKIRTSHAKLADVKSMIGSDARNGFVSKEIPGLNPMNGQIPSSSMGVHGFSRYNHHSESTDNVPRYEPRIDPKRVESFTKNEAVPDIDRYIPGDFVENVLDRNSYRSGVEQMSGEQYSNPPMMHDNAASFGSEEEVPGIENFQIIGDAKPGFKLLGCGYPVRGTSLCMFQWVRHYPDGTRQDIEGATNPDYIVTADDVDKLLAVECIPMDGKGRQGELVRIFANDNSKITCDEEMKQEIDSYIAEGQAAFNILILLDSSENWEPATLFLRRSGFMVKAETTQASAIVEKYSPEMLIKIPSGLSTQFVLTSSSGSSYPFSTSNDIRMRDTIVLTMRFFQSKAFDENRKVKA